MQQTTQTQGWHTAQWGMWGWAETILKLVAIAAAFVAVFRLPAHDTIGFGGNPHLIPLILAILLTLGAIFQLVVRLGQREIISVIFAVLNLLGHLGVVYVLLHIPGERTLPLVFGLFWFLGSLVKLQFLRVTGYTEGGATSSAMLRTTVIISVVYAVFTVLMLL